MGRLVQRILHVFVPHVQIAGNGTNALGSDGLPGLSSEFTLSCRLYRGTVSSLAHLLAGTSTPLNSPTGVSGFDVSGAMYISDTSSAVVRKLLANGTMTIVAGTLGVTGTAGNNVPGTSASLKSPRGLTLISSGAVLISDATAVRVLYPNRTLATLIGTLGTTGVGGDGGPGSLPF